MKEIKTIPAEGLVEDIAIVSSLTKLERGTNVRCLQ